MEDQTKKEITQPRNGYQKILGVMISQVAIGFIVFRQFIDIALYRGSSFRKSEMVIPVFIFAVFAVCEFILIRSLWRAKQNIGSVLAIIFCLLVSLFIAMSLFDYVSFLVTK